MSLSSRSRAFSLVEVAAVIVIIGILITGVVVSISLVKKARIQTAQSLTKSSPVTGIYENILWLESSLENSLLESETSDTDSISTWNNQSVSGIGKVTIYKIGSGPTYANTINYVPAVKFSGNTINYLKITDASFLNNTDYTIVVLEKRQTASAGYFLNTIDTNTNNAVNILALGYSSDGVVAHNSLNVNHTITPKVSVYADSIDKPRVFTFVQSSAAGKQTYINGVLAANDVSNTSQLSGITSLAIGRGYTGEIGEIAIFTKALTIEARKSVEDYLGKKWTRKILRDSSPSCINGIVTDSGCYNACSTASVTGVSTPPVVDDGSSGTLTCDNSLGYSGTVTYSCSGGNLNPVGNCSEIVCSISGLTGFNNQTGLVYAASTTALTSPCQVGHAPSTSPAPSYTCTATGAATTSGTCTSITCTAAAGTGYSAQSNLSYAASASGVISCNAGYEGSINYTCTSIGAATISGSCSAISCTVPSTIGTNTTTVNQASGTVPCDKAGASGGPANYTCSYGTFTPTGNACIVGPPSCSGGNTSLYTVSGEKVHAFLSSETLDCTSLTGSITAQVLVIGGGGGGGNGYDTNSGGGGGAGGFVYASAYPITATSYTVTVGAGGATASVNNTVGYSGSSSQFGTMTANGGGGGGYRNGTGAIPGPASSGGSGGGGPWNGSGAASTQTAQTNATLNYGYAGGNGLTSGSIINSGGGGGAGGVGGNANTTNAGNGAAGAQSSITGSATYYAAGGGGGNSSGKTPGTGGSSIGGNGGVSASAGATNTGSGGGGTDGTSTTNGAAGGSGIVIVRYVNPI
ncbi:MAG: type II secretion system protein [Pseudomonadota bacterium]